MRSSAIAISSGAVVYLPYSSPSEHSGVAVEVAGSSGEFLSSSSMNGGAALSVNCLKEGSGRSVTGEVEESTPISQIYVVKADVPKEDNPDDSSDSSSSSDSDDRNDANQEAKPNHPHDESEDSPMDERTDTHDESRGVEEQNTDVIMVFLRRFLRMSSVRPHASVEWDLRSWSSIPGSFRKSISWASGSLKKSKYGCMVRSTALPTGYCASVPTDGAKNNSVNTE
nr:hypothetical protein Iba_chr05cCG10990 [Ipomoea batatas]